MTFKISVVLTTKAGSKNIVPVTSVDADDLTVGGEDDVFTRRGDLSFYVVEPRLWRAPRRTLVAYFPAGTDWVVERA